MGVVCELYIIKDEEIKMLINNPTNFEEYLYENYTYTEGEKHIENETVFAMDKAWDIAKFLIKENDKSSTKVLSKLEGTPISTESYSGYKYILSEEVKEINKWLSEISIIEFKNAYNLEKMMTNDIYRADWHTDENWDYIVNHFSIYKSAFLKASEKESGIVIGFN